MKRRILAASAMLLAGAAYAGPPPQGYRGGFEQASILCDTQEQLQSIVEAFGEGTGAAQARYSELFATRNAKSEPTCAFAAVRVAVTGESLDLGSFEIDGSEFHAWSVHIRNVAGEGYYLHLERTKDLLMNTIDPVAALDGHKGRSEKCYQLFASSAFGEDFGLRQRQCSAGFDHAASGSDTVALGWSHQVDRSAL